MANPPARPDPRPAGSRGSGRRDSGPRRWCGRGSSYPKGDRRRRRGAARVKIEGGAVVEDVQPEPDEADRIVLPDPRHRAELEVGRIDDGDRAAADDLERVVGRDERRGILIEPDADREGIVTDRGEQSAQSVALAEVLVDDHAIREAETRCER